jgi:hydrogenase small subunit
MVNIVWLQGGGCTGCSVSFLNAQEPDVVQAIQRFGLDVVFHPTVGLISGKEALNRLEELKSGKISPDVLVVEGSVPLGPDGTGRYCMIGDIPFKDIVEDLAQKSAYTVAVGSCACWGGLPGAKENTIEHVGLQFRKTQMGGLLGRNYRSGAGLPVINLPGCPVHPDWVIQSLAALLLGYDVELDEFNRPKEFFAYYPHEGCSRNEYYDWKIDPEHLGDKGGCLYWEYGCKAPFTHADCNKRLWNRQSSCPRVGAPCIACVDPDFPDMSTPFFKRKDIPTTGIKKLFYMGGAAMMIMARPSEIVERHKKR